MGPHLHFEQHIVNLSVGMVDGVGDGCSVAIGAGVGSEVEVRWLVNFDSNPNVVNCCLISFIMLKLIIVLYFVMSVFPHAGMIVSVAGEWRFSIICIIYSLFPFRRTALKFWVRARPLLGYRWTFGIVILGTKMICELPKSETWSRANGYAILY